MVNIAPRGELLFQIGGNIAFIRETDQEKYCKYLIDTIPFIYYPIKSLNLSGIFHKQKLHNEYLLKLDLSKVKNSIVELDLSFCNLTDDEACALLTKQFALKNLKKLNLSNNKLTDNFFNLLIKNNSHEIFSNLKKIDLTNNNIQFSNIKEIKHFVKLFDSIKKLIIYDTPVEDIINNYITKRIMRKKEKKIDKEIKTEFNDEELNIEQLFKVKDNKDEKFENKSNIKLYLNNKNNINLLGKSKQLYPEIFNKIIMKCLIN